MFVIVEGIDRVGKTTLCNKLEKELGFKKYKIRNQFKFDNISHNVDVNEAILGMMKLCNENIVFDRFHMTEFVYGYCDRDCYGLHQYLSINSELYSLKNCLVILVNPVDVKKSSQEHGTDLTKHNEIFKELFNFYAGLKFSCDYNTLNEAINFVKEKMKND